MEASLKIYGGQRPYNVLFLTNIKRGRRRFGSTFIFAMRLLRQLWIDFDGSDLW